MQKKSATHIVFSGAALIAFFNIVSRVLGFFRDRLLASSFGAGSELDAYNVAFRFPDFLFNLIVVGAISAAFIPVFTSLWEQHLEKEAWRMTATVMTWMLTIIAGACVVIFFVAEPLVHVLNVNATGQHLRDAVWMTRLMLLSPFFFTVSTLAGGVLNSRKRFFAFALAPVLYNVGIVAGILLLTPYMGIRGVAIGVVVGAALHMLTQVPSMVRLGFRFQAHWHLDDAARKVFRLMLPRMVGLGVAQLDVLVSTFIASTVSIGAISVLSFANNLQSVIYSVVGISLSLAAFPMMAASVARKEPQAFVRTFLATARQIVFWTLPLAILLFLFRAQVVRLVLGTGKFDWDNTILTAATLGYFALGLLAQSLIPLVVRAFYAQHDTATPVLVSISSLLANIVLSFLFSWRFGVAGLGLAVAVSSTIQLVLLLLFLRSKTPNLRLGSAVRGVAQMAVAGVVMALVIQGLTFHVGPWTFAIVGGLKHVLIQVVNMHTFLGVATQTVVCSVVGLLLYWLITLAWGLPEAHVVRQLGQRFLRKPKL